MTHHMQRLRAFTLVEMLVALLIFSVILSIGAPSMLNMLRESKASTQSNQLLSYLQYARSEAVKRQENIEAQVSQQISGIEIKIVRTSNSEVLRRIVPTDTTVSLQEDNTVVFDSRGRSIQQTCVGVYIPQETTYSKRINVSLGGKIEMESGQCG